MVLGFYCVAIFFPRKFSKLINWIGRVRNDRGSRAGELSYGMVRENEEQVESIELSSSVTDRSRKMENNLVDTML